MIRIKKGLDLPITGSPTQKIDTRVDVKTVAVLGEDYIGMKPTMAVKVGQRVSCGDILFSNKKAAEINFTSPASGTVVAINRGDKRALLSVVVKVDGQNHREFPMHSSAQISALSREKIVENLVNSGQWVSIRTRPFSKAPDPKSSPGAIFVTAMDSNALSPDPELIIKERMDDFRNGLILLSKLSSGKTHVCVREGHELQIENIPQVEINTFAGPHPSGLVGTHIHFLHPVGSKRLVWHVGYQDVIALGKLFVSGKIDVDRVVSLAGPGVKKPRLIRTRLGASIDEIIHNELCSGEHRVVSGPLLAGHWATGPRAFLGRFHQQVSVVAEGREREFLGWQKPGFDKFSVKNIFASKMILSKQFPFTTSLEGSPRAMVPIGTYESIMPLDIEPTFFLRSIISGDTAQAKLLGALELDEEDLGLCSFVCPGKTVYGPLLRKQLTTIEEEG